MVSRPSMRFHSAHMHGAAHSIRHIVAIHARKSPLIVYLFTARREAFIGIFTIFYKVERIIKNADQVPVRTLKTS